MPMLSFALVAMLLLRSTTSLSMTSSRPPRPSSNHEFRSFEFDPSTGICRQPSSFRYIDPHSGDTQFFVMRNTPGDGDCVFHAVLSSVFISAGILNPDSALFSSTMSSMALEMRNVVAMFLSSPEGTLYVNNKPRKRIVRCRDLLRSAAQNEGLNAEDYLMKLRQPGKLGGLYGGGPELTVLSNILRRPISIYHLKQPTANATADNFREIKRMGVFGEGLFEDPGQSIPDSVVYNACFFTLGKTRTQIQQSPNEPPSLSSPLKCSWHLHILIADTSDTEKHATILLPSVPILHNK